MAGRAEGKRSLSERRRALFVFAHQDDEFGAAPWILEELRAGAEVRCVFLTDGGARTDPSVRDAESRAALRSLGVTDEAVTFSSDPAGGRIGDGRLAEKCADGLSMLERWIETTRFVPTRLYAPAYEGGHPDHDAAHVIAAAVASRLGIAGDAWQFALYNGYLCRKPFFHVLRQVPRDADSRRPALSPAERIRLTFLALAYRSQRRTWVGLLPGAIVERLLLARESVVLFDLLVLGRRPHEGELLYERIFGTTYAEFAASISNIVPSK